MLFAKWQRFGFGLNVLNVYTNIISAYRSGHEGAPVLLPGFAIIW